MENRENRSFKVVHDGCSRCNEKEAGIEVCILHIEHHPNGNPTGHEYCKFHKDSNGVWKLTGLNPCADAYFFFDSWINVLRELENELTGVTAFLTECRRNSAWAQFRRRLEDFLRRPHTRHCASGLARLVLLLHERLARFNSEHSDPSPTDWENQIIEAAREDWRIVQALADCFNEPNPKYVE